MTDAKKSSPGLFGRMFGRGAPKPEPTDAPSSDSSLEPVDGDPIPSPDAVPAEAEFAALDHATVQQSVDSDTVAEVDDQVSVAHAGAEVLAAPEQPKGWFARLKSGLAKTSSKLGEGITGLFTKRKLDVETLDDLEDLLIQSDLGVETATRITSALSKGRFLKGISAEDVRGVLAEEVQRVLEPVARPLVIDPSRKPHVLLMVGVNGTGKTTTIGKLASQFRSEGKSVMMAAGDTFRAAAVAQLKVWGERTGTPVVTGEVGTESSGLAFDAMKAAQAARSDVLLIDTAGRLQNKQALMDELEKLIRVVRKLDPTAPHDVLLVLDATTGQNALQQVDVFRERAGVTGLVMTKLDGTARGGILVAISAKYGLPVHAIGIGEGVADLQPFDAHEFARAIAAG